MSARSAPQQLSLKNEYSFRYSNFLMIGLCHSSANCRAAKSKGCWCALSSLLVTDSSRIAMVSDRACVTTLPELLAPEDVSSKT